MPNSTRGLRRLTFVLVLMLVIGTAAPAAANPPTTTTRTKAAEAVRHGTVGWDTFRRLDRLAEIGRDAKALQFSSFDRTDGNNDGFEGTYSCLAETDAGCVIADHTGAGEITSIWFTRDGGDVSKTGKITIELDGETVVDAPLQDLVDGKLGAPFTYPLVANADQSSGGVYVKVPMPYRSRMKITTQHNPFFYHVNYRTFATADGIETFDPADQALDVIETLRAAGTADPKPEQPNPRTIDKITKIAPGASAVLAESDTAGALTGIKLKLPQLAVTPVDRTRTAPKKPSPSGLDPRKARWIRPDLRTAAATGETRLSDEILAKARLKITFDGEVTVDVPLGEFFGSGLGLYPVKSLMFGMDVKTRTLTAWWLMPYAGSARVELYNGTDTELRGAASSVAVSDDPGWAEQLADGTVGHFRATANREHATFGLDHLFLEATGTGRVVGVAQTVEGLIPTGNQRNYLEGDERLFVDGSASPDQHGTGTEDFYEGGWYFNRGTFSAPLTGNPSHELAGGGCEFDCTGLYRLLLADGIDFESMIRFGIEHGPGNDADAITGSTTFWYGSADRTLQWTDSLDVGDDTSETEHDYSAAAPGEVITATSRYEGIDGPAEPITLDGRATTGKISFTLAVAEDNRGVLLRRLSDQAEPYQTARVSVDGKDAGLWRQPLGNATRRWLDDSHPLPAALTAGKTSITVILEPTGDANWHAAAYQALSRRPAAPDTEDPGPVAGLTADAGESTAVTLSWTAATDDDYAPRYEVHASTTAGFTPSEDTLAGVSRGPGFVHAELDVRQTWYYRVRAVDAAGHAGPYSDQVSATTGDTLRIEAESLFADATATAPLQVQGNCCGVAWSGGAQLWFTPTSADQTVTLTFELATAGTYALTGAQTLASDYGINELILDGERLGEPFDAYNSPEVKISDPIAYGSRELAAGKHTLVLHVTGKNPDSTSYMAGLDYLQLVLS
ncbi:DUF2961 domain-containing protein [Microlunatus parietis]|uniref:Fibronectin type-III domain-containing protein n=1 Tax=Microlunatus parietis TaxID=682979 RepID=A0A7Y9IB85_9ACTN|nr:DUF2961 domain-containing protein [Microlunatus parietis]NYE73448.1 hypothetical protein [Microlunatus parietis]